MLPAYPLARDFSAVTGECPLVILALGNNRCSACPAVAQKLYDHFGARAHVSVYYLTLDDAPELAARLGIFSAPAVLVYVQGQLTIREAGIFSVETLIARIERYLSLLDE